MWNGIRFIRWDLERRGKITDLHIRRLLSYSMFRVSWIVSINTHTHTSDHLLIMMRSTFERFTIRFRCRREKICCTRKYPNLHRLETPWDRRFTHKQQQLAWTICCHYHLAIIARSVSASHCSSLAFIFLEQHTRLISDVFRRFFSRLFSPLIERSERERSRLGLTSRCARTCIGWLNSTHLFCQ